MKLKLIFEGSSLTLFKGVSEYGGLSNWPEQRVGKSGRFIPGFLGDFETGRIYSEPSLTDSDDSKSMIVQFQINKKSIQNRSKEFKRWCDKNNQDYDVSMGFPDEWRDDQSIWTISDSGSAHGGNVVDGFSFVYCGIQLPYTVTAFYNNQAEWEQDS